MAVTDRTIVTLNHFQDYIGWNNDNATKDSEQEYILDIVSGAIEDYLDHPVKLVDETEILDGSGHRYQNVTYWPIDSIVGVSDAAKLANVQYRIAYDQSWTDLTDDVNALYVDPVRPWRIFMLDGTIFPCGSRNIRVEYYGGYSNIPATIEKVCLEMSAQMWKESGQSGDGRFGKQSQGIFQSGGNVSTVYRDMEPRFKLALDPYRKITLA